MAGPRVELYREGTVQRQIAQEPLMGPVDTGSRYAAQAVKDLANSGMGIAKTVSDNRMREETLRAKELYVQAKERLQERQSYHLSRKGHEALDDEQPFRDDIMSIVRDTRGSAAESLSERTQRELDLQLHEMVIGARGTSASKISQEQERVEASLNKQIADGANDAGFTLGQALGNATGNRWVGLLGQMGNEHAAAKEARIAYLKTVGQYNPETEEAERERAGSSYGLMVIKGAANDSGAAGAKSAFELLEKNEIKLVAGDAEQAKKLIASLEVSEKEDDRNTRIGLGVQYALQAETLSEMENLIRDLDSDVQVAVRNAAKAQLLAVKSERVETAANANETLNRYLSDNPGATLADAAQEHPVEWEAVKDNKQYVQRLSNREDITSDLAYYGSIFAMTPEQLREAYEKGEEGLKPGETNKFHQEIINRTNGPDSRRILSYINTAMKPKGSQDPKREVRSDGLRTLHQQFLNNIQTMYGGTPYEKLSGANREKVDKLYRAVNVRLEHELDKLEEQGLPPIISNDQFAKIVDEYKSPILESTAGTWDAYRPGSGVRFIWNDKTMKDLTAEQQDALLDYFGDGGKPGDLAPIFEEFGGVKIPAEDLRIYAATAGKGVPMKELRDLVEKRGFTADRLKKLVDVVTKNNLNSTAKNIEYVYQANKDYFDGPQEQ